jgi:hypothetical protein
MDLDMVRAHDRVGRIYQYINMVRLNMVLTGMHVSQFSEFALIDMFPHLTKTSWGASQADAPSSPSSWVEPTTSVWSSSQTSESWTSSNTIASVLSSVSDDVTSKPSASSSSRRHHQTTTQGSSLSSSFIQPVSEPTDTSSSSPTTEAPAPFATQIDHGGVVTQQELGNWDALGAIAVNVGRLVVRAAAE